MMWGWLVTLVKNNALKTAQWAFMAMGIIAILFGARSGGRSAERAEVLEARRKRMLKANETRKRLRRLSDHDALERLYAEWPRQE